MYLTFPLNATHIYIASAAYV